MKLKLSLCMSITFGALGNKFVDSDNHILNFFTGGFEKSVIEHRVVHVKVGNYSLFGKFHVTFVLQNLKMGENIDTHPTHVADFDILCIEVRYLSSDSKTITTKRKVYKCPVCSSKL